MIHIGEIVSRYFETLEARKAPSLAQLSRSWGRYAGAVPYKRAHIEKAIVERLDSRELVRWFNRLAEVAPVSGRDEVRKVLSAALRLAAKEGRISLEASRVSTALTAHHSLPRTRQIPSALIPRLMCALELRAWSECETAEDTRRARLGSQACLLYIYTGARCEELRTAKLEDVTIEGELAYIRLARTKNGLPHYLPLCAEALKIIKEIVSTHPHKRAGEFLLQVRKERKPISRDAILWALGRACEEVGVERVSLHDLRRTSASVLASHGESVETVDRFLNHQKLNAVQRCYFQPNARLLCDIAARLEAYLDDGSEDEEPTERPSTAPRPLMEII